MRRSVILVGAGGHARSCIDVIEAGKTLRVAGVLDVPAKVGTKVLGHRIIGTDADIGRLARRCGRFLVTVGQIKSADRRKSLFEKILAAGAEPAVVVSPLAHISKNARVGAGTIVMHRTVVNAGAQIGRNCIINTGAVIEHDAVIGDHCHISTGSYVNGGCRIGPGSFVGSRAVIANGVEVAPGVVIGAGAVVVKNITRPGTYAGNPARPIGGKK